MNFKFMHPAEQIVMLLNRVYQNGLTTTSGGNLSIKDSEGNIWITPSGIDKGSLTPGDICKILPDGTCIGKYKPSVELPFHKNVYACRPDVSAVLHAHPPAIVSYSLVREIPDVNVIPVAKKILHKIGIAKYEVPGSFELAERIVAEIKKGLDIVVMENHGVIVCADDLFKAYKMFETFNYIADINIIARGLGGSKPLTQDQFSVYGKKAEVVLEEYEPNIISSEEKRLRKEMCNLIRRAYDQKLFTSTQGTFSVRLDENSYLITPYGVDRKYIEPEDIIRIENGKTEKGKVASRSVKLHERIYKDHPEINSIAMAQPKHLMAFAIAHKSIDSKTIPESYIEMRDMISLPFGTNITDYDKVSKTITKHSPVIIIENDCVISTANSLIKAFDKMEVAEFTATTIINAGLLGDIVMINDKEVKAINDAFHLD